jgi:hypothetical protein
VTPQSTEYNNGGGEHIAGIAQADNLGIFGAQGVFAAALWPLRRDRNGTARVSGTERSR